MERQLRIPPQFGRKTKEDLEKQQYIITEKLGIKDPIREAIIDRRLRKF
jgi:hypothetical protein